MIKRERETEKERLIKREREREREKERWVPWHLLVISFVISYEEKKLYKIGPTSQCYKTVFFFSNKQIV